MNLPEFLTRDAYGEILLTGHRIGLYTIVEDCREGHSAEEIASEYPTLPLSLVTNVLDFYAANRAEVDTYVDEMAAEIKRQAAQPAAAGVLRVRQIVARHRQTKEP